MDPGTSALIEGVGFLALVAGFGLQQLRSTERAKRARVEREKAASEGRKAAGTPP